MEKRMKLSNETIDTLKHFAGINQNIEFKKGKVLKTVSPLKNILVKTTVKDDFPEDFCIYDLNQFLTVHTLYKDTEIDFKGNDIVFKSPGAKSKINYRKAAKNNIVCAPDGDLEIDEPLAEFVLTEDVINSLLKSAHVLQHPDATIESDGTKLYATSFEAKNDASHINKIEIGDYDGESFKAEFKVENLKLIPGTYNVIFSENFAQFTNQKVDLIYWITLESWE